MLTWTEPRRKAPPFRSMPIPSCQPPPGGQPPGPPRRFSLRPGKLQTGSCPAAFVATRPPGHHATPGPRHGFLFDQPRGCRGALASGDGPALSVCLLWTGTFTMGTARRTRFTPTGPCSTCRYISRHIIRAQAPRVRPESVTERAGRSMCRSRRAPDVAEYRQHFSRALEQGLDTCRSRLHPDFSGVST